jgi:nicotinamidase-related amidase
MSREAVSNVSYPVAPGTTVLLTIDCQFGFGTGGWEQVPHADAAVENLRRAALAWRECGGEVVHAYLFAAVQDTDAFVAQVRAPQPAAG